jgi:hypothetical protein
MCSAQQKGRTCDDTRTEGDRPRRHGAGDDDYTRRDSVAHLTGGELKPLEEWLRLAGFADEAEMLVIGHGYAARRPSGRASCVVPGPDGGRRTGLHDCIERPVATKPGGPSNLG